MRSFMLLTASHTVAEGEMEYTSRPLYSSIVEIVVLGSMGFRLVGVVLSARKTYDIRSCVTTVKTCALVSYWFNCGDNRMFQKIGSAVAFILLVVAGGGGYIAVKSHLESEIYRDRLQALGEDYTRLAADYQDAVRKSAVTELRVRDNQLSVLVRTMEGVLEEIPTPFDPRREIYVDYVVLDNRLWIRRIFDHETPPSEAILINPRLLDINWDERSGQEYGKAVYRRLGEGRWAVTVTGSGALGLRQVSADSSIDLVTPPEIRDFSELQESIRKDISEIGPGEVVRRLLNL